ncbi:MAG TPA: M1 family metallopeptidase [Gaiellaceae bacterium]|nr:M1 family metallopeptidase [Gaiellaceae bacterium]
MGSHVQKALVRDRRGAIRRAALLACAVLVMALGPALAQAGGGPPSFEPGAPGVGDPYFPLDGNGGYDARHYLLDVKYDPATDVLAGDATMRARATQNLSSFNLDLDGLTVHSIRVNGRPAAWTHDEGELTVTPRKGLRKNRSFVVVVRYSGIPETLTEFGGSSGFIHTDDGALVVGEPHVAATWYPVNDHPSDKAAYTFRVTVPKGLEAVANGVLKSRKPKGAWTTWTWDAKEPMASYLTTATVGEFDLRAYKRNGIRFWDAIDPDLFEPPAMPRTGSQFAISQRSQPSFKRLQRTITVPAGGASMSFWVTRDTEQNWDFFFVEAHTAGLDDWTTLPDLNGHTSQDTGFVCPFWLELHPFLEHYQSANEEGTCDPVGTTGSWHAVSGGSDGYEQWNVDLSAYAGKDVVVSISYASDDLIQRQGVFVDDVVVSTGEGSTSFEDDGDTLDGWTVPGAPDGSAPNENDWIVGTAADTPEPVGFQVEASFALQDDIIEFLANRFGSYPFSAAGGIVDDFNGLGFALENQTRPIYAVDFFFDPVSAEDVVVHELAHQWYGDSLTVAAWQHIWLNEGFATYAEWLWSEDVGRGTAQEIFDFFYSAIPEDDPFWAVTIGDPGPDLLFDFAVYARGAMTLHQLRLAVGDEDFFRILRRWATKYEGGNVTTDQFIALAEKVSGEELDELFQTWLFTDTRPESPSPVSAAARAAAGASGAPVAARSALDGKLRAAGVRP